MNTPKKEDMEIEIEKLIRQVGVTTINALGTLNNLLAMTGRATYLKIEIDRVTPVLRPEEEITLDTHEKTNA